MRKLFFAFLPATALLGSLFTASIVAQTPALRLPVIPQPAQVRWVSSGPDTLLWQPGNTQALRYSSAIKDSLPMAIGAYNRAWGNRHGKGSAPIHLQLQKELPTEGYRLHINNQGITLQAATSAGFFYGMQTLIQLAEGNETLQERTSYPLPKVEITDAPRFAYRGLHLDVSRHFMSLDSLCRQIDNMARYKLNRFHWHLTDGGGWRAEIKQYPRLTHYTAHRPYKNYMTFWENGRRYCVADAPLAQGGYYTQEQMRKLVQYAAERNVTVIPEIEMPGHSEALLAAYPEISCSGQPYMAGEVCPGKEKTFEVLQGILDEVLEIFPSPYIHIGGDEAEKRHWEKCPHCQERMRAEGLKTPEELQSYLIHRIERYLLQKGRHIIGWDEIMEGGLAPGATVMSWRGESGGIAAARSKQKVVMVPNSHLYLDYYQDAPINEPLAMGGYLPLGKVYSYNPVPDSLAPQYHSYIWGVQANLWTEYVPNAKHMEYMLYPRVCALAEVAWTPLNKKDSAYFRQRALAEVTKLKARGYNAFNLAQEQGPRAESLKAIQHLARGAKVVYNKPYSSYYPAGGETALTNGLRGDWRHGDGRWQGTMQDVDVVIDLGKLQSLRSISTEFMQQASAWIHLPQQVEYSVSADGKEFTPVATLHHNIPLHHDRLTLHPFVWEGSTKARYIRLQAKQSGRAGGWLFLDEIVVK